MGMDIMLEYKIYGYSWLESTIYGTRYSWLESTIYG